MFVSVFVAAALLMTRKVYGFTTSASYEGTKETKTKKESIHATFDRG